MKKILTLFWLFSFLLLCIKLSLTLASLSCVKGYEIMCEKMPTNTTSNRQKKKCRCIQIKVNASLNDDGINVNCITNNPCKNNATCKHIV